MSTVQSREKPQFQWRGYFTQGEISEIGLVEPIAIHRRLGLKARNGTTDGENAGCCPFLLTGFLRNAARQLDRLRIFPHQGEDESVIIRIACWTILACRNQMTSASAYHLLHVLHHLNGAAVHRTNSLLINDSHRPSVFDRSSRLEPAILSALINSYIKGGVRPARFRLYSRILLRHFPPNAELLLPARALIFEEDHFYLGRGGENLGAALEWVAAGFHSQQLNSDRAALPCMASRPWHAISFSANSLTGAQVEKIVEASFTIGRLERYGSHVCILDLLRTALHGRLPKAFLSHKIT